MPDDLGVVGHVGFGDKKPEDLPATGPEPKGELKTPTCRGCGYPVQVNEAYCEVCRPPNPGPDWCPKDLPVLESKIGEIPIPSLEPIEKRLEAIEAKQDEFLKVLQAVERRWVVGLVEALERAIKDYMSKLQWR